MRIQRAAPANELLAKILFLILPTALVGYFLLQGLTDFYSLPINNSLQWALAFGAGMVGSALFHGFRFRALLPFAGLITLLWFIYKGIDRLPLGEFDQPKVEGNFYVMSTLLVAGWIVGWGFARIRRWSILIAAALLVACIAVIAKHNVDTVERLEKAFAPALLFSVYIIFTAEQIYSYGDKEQKFWWFLSRRLIAFAAVAALMIWGVFRYYDKEIKQTVASYGAGGKAGKNSMLKADSSGNFDLAHYSQLRSSLGRSNELLFCARIDNYFPNTEVPNPLYLTAFYYTKFDTSTETFEPDSTIPNNDLFQPDPSRITLFGQKYDSSVIKNSGTEKGGKTVEVQVYSRKLSAGTYLAPHTGYFVQPITVEKDFRDSFKYAFRAKSWVSELNSAYFVYNSPQEEIRAFQEKRFEILRKAAPYGKESPRFMKYYTYMPGDAKFARISQLAHDVTAKATTPVDKVLAIRDWFLSKDAGGQPLFKYTDNPGIPDIPSASKLQYFLFENRKGYCAYFAGATLFMLRSLGIPSRLAVGFLTVDRSGGKNKGWYWYYADQAHAWVQVYIPGYGWLDFDTTVGNDEAQQAPQTDGTPPMQPPVAFLSADGIVTSVDTAKRTITYKLHHFILHDKEFNLPEGKEAVLDVHVAAIRRDSVDVPLSVVKPGDSVTAVSYADAFKNLSPRTSEGANALLSRFPAPEPVDEVYLKRSPEERKKDTPPVVQKAEEPFSWKCALLITAIVAASIIALILLLPLLVMMYFNSRARSAKSGESKAYWTYRAASYYLHQLGYPRGTRTPMQYARELIDPALGTSFGIFMNSYLKVKYAKQPLTMDETTRVAAFLPQLRAQVASRIPAKRRLAAFLNPVRMAAFFLRPSDDATG